MKTILVPVDFSGTTQVVVAFAAELAGHARARMMLLHVTQPGLLLKERTKLEKLVERMFARDPACGEGTRRMNGDSLALIGKPAAIILDQARRLAADYIVMGARRPTKFARRSPSGMTRRVLREAKCPVILVPGRNPARQHVRSICQQPRSGRGRSALEFARPSSR